MTGRPNSSSPPVYVINFLYNVSNVFWNIISLSEASLGFTPGTIGPVYKEEKRINKHLVRFDVTFYNVTNNHQEYLGKTISVILFYITLSYSGYYSCILSKNHDKKERIEELLGDNSCAY